MAGDPKAKPVLRRRALTALLNLVVFAAFAWAVEHWWGWSRLLAPWRTIPPATLLLVLAGMLTSYAIRALRIYIAEVEIPRGAYFACLRLIVINSALNLLLPARSGEASFPILLKRWFGIEAARGTGTLIWLRLLDLHVLAALGAACAAVGVMRADTASRLVWLLALLAALAPLAVFALHRPLAAVLNDRGGRAFALARQALAGVPARAGAVARDLFLTWASWLVKLAALGWVLARLADAAPVAGVLGAIGGDLSTVLPVHAPGGFGTYEAGVLALAAPAAAHDQGWRLLVAGAVNLHLLLLTVALTFGGLAWLAAARWRGAAANSRC